MHPSLRWIGAALVAITCAAAGVMVAAWVAPPREVRASPTPVVVEVTTTSTAHPLADPAPVASASGINLSEHSIDEAGSIWLVVNKQRPIDPIDYEPWGLRNVKAPGGRQLTDAAAKAYERMEAAARGDGIHLTVSTAYRSYNFQKGLFNDYANQHGVAKAETFSARPGYSEHQTGLSLDVDDGSGCHLRPCFGDTDAGKWLVAHAAEFGYIERYPEGATKITGYTWEPWHWRYVGTDLAQYMRDQRIETLEEVFGLPAAPTYK
jgi:zinc D-Ala-D-Ala carboxypeptidase